MCDRILLILDRRGMAKPIKIQHPTPVKLPYAILPIGMYCNRQLQMAKPGDLVEFWSDWRHDVRRIVRICRFRINSPEFTFMLRSIYGNAMSIAKLMERWEAAAIVDGIGRNGIDRERCIILEVADDSGDIGNNKN